ncbi:MAG: type II toxin-antitoxin system VapC family toxin [Rhizobiaceae bacterium]|nr:type II toxin-antitoxin system VapC family toxin [Rhizobiaceae bacterium]
MLFDTNVVSDARRRDRTTEAFKIKIDSFPDRETFISVLTLTEIRIGIQRQSKRDRTFERVLNAWLRTVVEDFRGRILPITQPIALLAGTLPCSLQQPTYDALIAATALHHGHTVVTRNLRDFMALGVATLDPWQG